MYHVPFGVNVDVRLSLFEHPLREVDAQTIRKTVHCRWRKGAGHVIHAANQIRPHSSTVLETTLSLQTTSAKLSRGIGNTQNANPGILTGTKNLLRQPRRGWRQLQCLLGRLWRTPRLAPSDPCRVRVTNLSLIKTHGLRITDMGLDDADRSWRRLLRFADCFTCGWRLVEALGRKPIAN